MRFCPPWVQLDTLRGAFAGLRPLTAHVCTQPGQNCTQPGQNCTQPGQNCTQPSRGGGLSSPVPGYRPSMTGEAREGVTLTNLDQPLFDGAGATKRDLVDYVDAMADRIVGAVGGRPCRWCASAPGRHPSCRRTSRAACPTGSPR